MATFTKFEDIDAWKRAHQAVVLVYQLSNSTALNKDFALRDQMRRAAISITSNIAEGHDRGTKKEFVYFLNVSKASCSELVSQVILAKDLEYITQEDYDKLYKELTEVGKMIGGLIKYLKTQIPSKPTRK